MGSVVKLGSLKKKRDTLNSRIRLIQNRKQAIERKDSTRRKILIGAYYLEQANKSDSYNNIVKLMNSYLTRDSDRRLFGLDSLKNTE